MKTEKFWSRVDKKGPIYKGLGRCWNWIGGKFNSGYGNFVLNGECSAHRVSFKIHNGEIPKGLLVLHKCDNPICVNPKHLFIGTQQHNMDDCVSKGRQAKGDRQGARLHPETTAKGFRNGAHTHPERRPKGESHGRALLTEHQVRTMKVRLRKRRLTQPEIAYLYGVSLQVVERIARNVTWRHVV